MKLKKITNIKTLGVIAVIGCSLSLQSCIVAAAMGGLGAMRYGDAKKAEAETKCKKEYPNYYTSMQKINQSKARSHEKSEAIMTMEEYCHIEKDEKKGDGTKA
jgi:hypothetical protein